MKHSGKDLLVYADGHTREYPDGLFGMKLIESELRADGYYEREFEVTYARTHTEKDSKADADGTFTMVGIETSFERKCTIQEWHRRSAEMREDLLREQLKAILGAR